MVERQRISLQYLDELVNDLHLYMACILKGGLHISNSTGLTCDPTGLTCYLLIGHDIIPWSTIDHISVKRSEVGNLYVAFYFEDDIPPKGFDIEHIENKETFLKYLKENAAERGYGFEIEGT